MPCLHIPVSRHGAIASTFVSTFTLLLSLPATALAEDVTYPTQGYFSDATPLYNLVGPSGSNRGKNTSISNNVVTINGNRPGQEIYYAIGAMNALDSDAVTNNTLIINNDTYVYTQIYGGYANPNGRNPSAVGNAIAIGNRVFFNGTARMADTASNARIIGGIALSNNGSSSASYNSITITSKGIGGAHGIGAADVTLYGGWAQARTYALVNSNTATITNGSKATALQAGYATINFNNPGATAMALFNSGTVNNGSLTTLVGGRAFSQFGGVNKIAFGNVATLINGSVALGIYGGWASASSVAGLSEASNNTVIIRNGDVGWDTLARVLEPDPWIAESLLPTEERFYALGEYSQDALHVYGGRAQDYGIAITNDNLVNISGNTMISGDIFGGSSSGIGAVSTAANTARAASNVVNISNSAVRDIGIVYGGTVYGGYAYGSDMASAFGNTVNLNGGTLTGNLYGGYARSNNIAGHAIAENNILNINGGTVEGNIYGGYATNSAGGIAIAENNSVNLYGNPNIVNSIIYGGWANDSSLAFGGNVFHMYSSGVTAAGLENFQNLHFHIPSTLSVGGSMLYITGGVANVGDTFVTLDLAGRRAPLREGDYFVLIDATSGLLDGIPDNDTALAGVETRGRQGSTLLYEFEILANPDIGGTIYTDELWARLAVGRGPVVDPITESLNKGFLTGIASLNEGSELIAGWSASMQMNQAERRKHLYGLVPFVALTGGTSRYETGCHTDLKGFSMMAGLAKHLEYQSDNLLLGAFIEYGTASYETYTSVIGDGNLNYFGSGVIGRRNFSNNFYAEASVRAGQMRNKYSYNYAFSDWASYRVSSPYYGLYTGGGYTHDITGSVSLEPYIKYFWTRQDGDSTTMSTGDPLKFDSVNSHRLRAGARVNHTFCTGFDLYAGAALEHEFDGKASATTYGYPIGSASLKGNTGMGELGVNYQASACRPLFVELSVQGYAGKREGGTGTARVRYEF